MDDKAAQRESWVRGEMAMGESAASPPMTEREKVLAGALEAYEKAMTSHVDGRDLLEQLNIAAWHHCDIVVRINGEDRYFEADWLKSVWYARRDARAALATLTQESQGHD